MKKTISWFVMASFVFSLAAISIAKAEDSSGSAKKINLEKISSPEQIKYFNVIRKEGNILFGVRKATSTLPVATSTLRIATATPHIVASTSDNLGSSLEKILHPSLINLFENVRKIGTALWGVKKEASSTSTTIAPEISACVISAINTKDKAIISRVTAAATELNTALATRSTCQQTALAATSTQRSVLNACVKTFNEARKTIKETSKKTQTEIWEVYRNSLKACPATINNTSAVPMVEDGGSVFE